ncbi:uncharacterized protein [Rutidosis leptorrhynchoides]|uniref:uncharacterized protein n=1 Tax=Rutidosis leptorrhynchoides TaxID=125765 RepID=UPI003A98EDC4
MVTKVAQACPDVLQMLQHPQVFSKLFPIFTGVWRAIDVVDVFTIWRWSILLALATKKVGSVDGTFAKNNTDNVLAAHQIFSSIAFVVWTKLKDTYDKVDGSNIFNLHSKINTIKRHGTSVSEYFHKLNTLWKQYDAILNLVACTCDVAIGLRNHDKLLRCTKFLMGLNDTYMHNRSNILVIDPFPDVKTVFFIISREKSHRGSATRNNSARVQTSTFVAQDTKSKFYNN